LRHDKLGSAVISERFRAGDHFAPCRTPSDRWSDHCASRAQVHPPGL
jgi:hypothetical protein